LLFIFNEEKKEKEKEQNLARKLLKWLFLFNPTLFTERIKRVSK
jgi:hypothetical protein